MKKSSDSTATRASKVRCKAHGFVMAEKIEPCAEYPYGAIVIKDKHRGEPCERTISLTPAQSQISGPTLPKLESANQGQ